MGICSKDKATDVEQVDGFEGRYADLGGYTVGWESFEDAMDPAELFVGLPDDACQSPHWGVVLSGAITFRYTDGTTEVAEAVVALEIDRLARQTFDASAVTPWA